jgi:glutamate-1-semialdehyde 2,1-aminomutase
MKIDKSKKLMGLSEAIVPGGVNSPVRAFKAVGGTPRVIERGEGAYLYDVDGNRYLDFCCSWGPLIFGHADRDVVRAVEKQAALGLTYGTATELEYQLADLIVSHVEAVGKIRFVSSGTEAVMSAVRVARGFTRRDLILKFEGCYHGHCDHLLVKGGSGLATFGQPSSAGVPAGITSDTAVLPLDDENRLEDFFRTNGDKAAAVIIEGIPANNGLLIQRREYVQYLRSVTEKYGALLIFDEVITGFRLGLGGAAEYYGVTPDIITFGKIIGGGMPVGAFGGRAEIMNMLSPVGPVYQAGTLSGNPIAMTAGLTTLQKLADGKIYNYLEKMTNQFTGQLKEKLGGLEVQVVSIGSIFWVVFQSEPPRSADKIDPQGIKTFNAIHGSILDQGIYLPPSGYEVSFVSAAHTEEMLHDAADTIANVIRARSA